MRKKLLLLTLAALPIASIAQTPFTLKGKISGIENGEKIFLSYVVDRKSTVDSTIVDKGQFLFEGQIKNPTRANLYRKPKVKGEKSDALAFYIEPKTISFETADSLKNTKITGSVINDDNLKLQAQTKLIQQQLASINAEFAKLTEEQRKDKALVQELTTKYYAASDQLTPIYIDFAKKNPKSYIALVNLTQAASNEKYQAEAENTYNAFSAELKNSEQGKTVSGIFDAAKRTKIGVIATDFTQNDVNDKPVKLSDFKGKYVLIDFWASWCGPCRKENPNVVAAYNKFKDKDFTILGISLDQPGKKDAWLKAIEDDQLTWTHVSDLKFWDNEVAKLYGIRSIPANYLIDPTGKIIAKGLRGEELHTKLAEVLVQKAK